MSRITNQYGMGLGQLGGANYLLRTPSEQNLNGGKGFTPTRPRLIGASELNGTPISLARKGERMASPLLGRINKENQQTNVCQPSPGKLAIKIKPTVAMGELQQENRTKSPLLRDKPLLGGTLSPFNKMSEGLKNYMQYNTLPATDSQPEKYQTLAARIEMEKHSSATDHQEDVLKTSNSFKLLGSRKNSLAALSPLAGLKDKSPSNLNEKKLKNEVIDDIIKNCGRKQQQQQQLLKTSNGSSPFLGFGQQQKQQPLTDSKSYGKFESNKFKNAIRESTNHQNFLAAKARDEENDGYTMCLNKDGREAKYRVVNNNPDDDDEEPMHYCSNCAVQLIQQGFKVEPIEEGGSHQHEQYDPLVNRITDLTDKLTGKRDRLRKSKDSYTQQYQKDLNQVDSYYDSLISTIEELRVKERESILHHRDTVSNWVMQSQQHADEQLNQLQTALTRLSQLQSDAKRKTHTDNYRLETELRHFSGLCEQPERSFSKTIQVEDKLQDRFDHFVNSLYQEFTLKIEECGRHEPPAPQVPHQLYKQQSFGETLSNQQAGKSVNFSFEKNMPRAAKKLDPLQHYIKEESEVEQKNDSEEKERKPFRNLFPEESEHSDSQLCDENLMSNDQDKPQQGLAPAGEGYDCYSPSFKNM